MTEENVKKQYNKMMNTSIPKLVTEMALPAVISMMITVIYNTADTYFVAQIDSDASAAVGIVYTIMAVIQAVGYGLCMGAGSLVSRMLGKKENDRANMYASSAFFVSFLIGLTVGAIGLIFEKPILTMLGCDGDTIGYATDYATYILIAAPLSCSTFVLNNVLRAAGQTTFAMFGMGFGGILNIFLDRIFIFNFGLKTAGASLATAASQLSSFLILGFVYVTGRSVVTVKIKSVSKSFKDYREIVLTGLPTIFRQGMGAVSSALLNKQGVTYYGNDAVAAITVANKVYTLVRNMVLGIGQGFQPVAGYNFGAGNKKRTWEAFRFTALLGTVICLIMSGIILTSSEPIMRWFYKDENVVKIGVQTLKYCAEVMPVLAISTYVNVMYQCLGFKWQATFLASCRQGLFFIPIILILPRFAGLSGVELTQPLSDLATFMISVPFLAVFYNKHINEKRKRQ